ncbi:MAG: hypothetical protein ACXWC9_08820 [Pseudobdellovibrionaceae bacterium]
MKKNFLLGLGSFAILFCLSACSSPESSVHQVQDSVNEVPEGPTPVPVEEPPTPKEFRISDSRIVVSSDYKVRLLIDQQWQEFFGALPSGDLTDRKITLASPENLKAQLTCLNADCNKSRVMLLREDPKRKESVRRALLQFEYFKLRTVGSQILRDCQAPIFFDYELQDLIGERMEIMYSIEQLKSISEITATSSDLGAWREGIAEDAASKKSSRSLLIELSVQDQVLLTLTDSVLDGVSFEILKNDRHLKAERISYGMGDSASLDTLNHMVFHFPLPLPENPRHELCYSMPLNPHILPAPL